jgi:hypothetical protein
MSPKKEYAMKVVLTIALAAALAAPCAAQEKKADKPAEKAAASKPAAAMANPAAGGMGAIYGYISETVVKAAEKMPEEKWSFKPTPEVRSFGEVVAHVADAQNFLCPTAMGNPKSYSPDVEKGKTSKADIIGALKESNAACAKVFAQSDAEMAKPQSLFGRPGNRFSAATIVVGHAFEHYGNLVTYLRMNSIVPPSSEPPPAAPKTEEKKSGK